MYNLLQIEDRLKGLPDQTLGDYMLKPQTLPPGMPQYMIMSEMTRRKDMRKREQGQDKEPIRPQEVLFIDDWPGNVEAVRSTGASTLLFGRDVRSIHELANILD